MELDTLKANYTAADASVVAAIKALEQAETIGNDEQVAAAVSELEQAEAKSEAAYSDIWHARRAVSPDTLADWIISNRDELEQELDGIIQGRMLSAPTRRKLSQIWNQIKTRPSEYKAAEQGLKVLLVAKIKAERGKI